MMHFKSRVKLVHLPLMPLAGPAAELAGARKVLLAGVVLLVRGGQRA